MLSRCCVSTICAGKESDFHAQILHLYQVFSGGSRDFWRGGGGGAGAGVNRKNRTIYSDESPHILGCHFSIFN